MASEYGRERLGRGLVGRLTGVYLEWLDWGLGVYLSWERLDVNHNFLEICLICFTGFVWTFSLTSNYLCGLCSCGE